MASGQNAQAFHERCVKCIATDGRKAAECLYGDPEKEAKSFRPARLPRRGALKRYKTKDERFDQHTHSTYYRVAPVRPQQKHSPFSLLSRQPSIPCTDMTRRARAGACLRAAAAIVLLACLLEILPAATAQGEGMGALGARARVGVMSAPAIQELHARFRRRQASAPRAGRLRLSRVL